MTAKIIRLALVRPAPWPKHASPPLDGAPFMSTCPTCNEPRLQMGYGPWGLIRRLKGDRPIEAWCVTCDRFWPISVQERLALAKELEHSRPI